MVYSASMATHQLLDYSNTGASGPTLVQQPQPAPIFHRDQRFVPSADHAQRLAKAAAGLKPNSGTTRTKRRNSDSDDCFKKTKQSTTSATTHQQIPTEELTLDNINLEEYPKFHHPEGGFIQFTPLGNIRTFLSDNNVMQRVIEQNSTFDINNLTHGIDGYTLYLGSNGFEVTSTPYTGGKRGLQLSKSPSNEIENYMRNGYDGVMSPSSSGSGYYCDGGSSNSCAMHDYYDADSDLEDDDGDESMF